MLDREGRVVFGSFLLFVLARAGSIVLERQLGLALRDRPIPSLFLFAGVAVALPQLYLAFADEEPTSRSRLRVATIATAAFAAVFAPETDGVRSLLIGAVGVGSILGLLCYEALSGYHASPRELATRLR
ncbi:hypothetical protein [Natrinema sp. 1APR25-10V2]|uniref:hypothetical protein n=1 Tax=Natrinema sp. 1APR25-10V2 TaxID=2951081 RepID=UPI00287405C4|nr:hypothetical protein [Natrinema sp. 1APR25-10V2]MDS0473595.1 hypothetical protein [Natrinema sp. 1APR25-10V2]